MEFDGDDKEASTIAKACQLRALPAAIVVLLATAVIALFTDLNILSNLPHQPPAAPSSSPAAAAQLLPRRPRPTPPPPATLAVPCPAALHHRRPWKGEEREEESGEGRGRRVSCHIGQNRSQNRLGT